jgi:hypothetical protein
MGPSKTKYKKHRDKNFGIAMLALVALSLVISVSGCASKTSTVPTTSTTTPVTSAVITSQAIVTTVPTTTSKPPTSAPPTTSTPPPTTSTPPPTTSTPPPTTSKPPTTAPTTTATSNDPTTPVKLVLDIEQIDNTGLIRVWIRPLNADGSIIVVDADFEAKLYLIIEAGNNKLAYTWFNIPINDTKYTLMARGAEVALLYNDGLHDYDQAGILQGTLTLKDGTKLDAQLLNISLHPTIIS